MTTAEQEARRNIEEYRRQLRNARRRARYIRVGQQVTITGYTEDGKPIILRDENGRPI